MDSTRRGPPDRALPGDVGRPHAGAGARVFCQGAAATDSARVRARNSWGQRTAVRSVAPGPPMLAASTMARLGVGAADEYGERTTPSGLLTRSLTRRQLQETGHPATNALPPEMRLQMNDAWRKLRGGGGGTAAGQESERQHKNNKSWRTKRLGPLTRSLRESRTSWMRQDRRRRGAGTAATRCAARRCPLPPNLSAGSRSR